MTNSLVSKWVKRFSGFAVQRSLPTLYKLTLRSWYKKHRVRTGRHSGTGNKIYLFCDEFSNYNDTQTGIITILLLERLGYEVIIPKHLESGRTWLSKGLLRKAKSIANRNIELLAPLISEETPMVGIEPSAILSFRDEYVDLADEGNLEPARHIAKHVYLLEEFIVKESNAGRIRPEQFTREKKTVYLHAHCQQKAVASSQSSLQALAIPANYTVRLIPSGCCGMAGSFGYEKEHFDLSMKVGELVLLPAVRSLDQECLLAAPGTSCRHQIKDGTGRKAQHPAEILYSALI